MTETGMARLDRLQSRLEEASAANRQTASLDAELRDAIHRQDDLVVLQAFAEKYPHSKHGRLANERITTILDGKTIPRHLLALQGHLVQTNELARKVQRRFSEVLNNSSNLQVLAECIGEGPGGKYAEMIENQAKELITSWPDSTNDSKVERLFGFALGEWRTSPLASLALKYSRDCLEKNFERVGEEEHGKEFPWGKIVDAEKPKDFGRVKPNAGRDMDSAFNPVMMIRFRESEGMKFIFRSPTNSDWINSDTLVIGDFRYDRQVFGDRKTVREVIVRLRPGSAVPVRTEVVFYDGIYYRRKSRSA
jgi:hypothetical protein